MNFDSDPEDEHFRAETRTFIRSAMAELFPDKMSVDSAARTFDRADSQRWARCLNAKGLLVPHWPCGQRPASWRPAWRRILAEELFASGSPPTDTIGTEMVGPMLCTFGSEYQKRRYLPAICSGDHYWCQGFSEPQAGSDVMSLQGTAVRDRDYYTVNAHKIWTSNAHNADMMFALLRIQIPGARQQQGVSFLLIDMRSPGVEVTPIILIDGIHRVNEVLLRDVRVPVVNLVGEAGKGWVYARSLLGNERALIAGLGRVRLLLDRLAALAARSSGLTCSSLLASRISECEIDLLALEFMELRLLHAPEDSIDLQLLPPMLKLRASELRQRITALTVQVLGESALEFPAPGSYHPVVDYLFERSATLAGGTSEIQKNIIAGVALKL